MKIRLAQMFSSILLLFLCLITINMTQAATPQWTIFETQLTSVKQYDNPVQEIKVDVTFTAPDGTTRTFKGFWNGRDEWRVRFSPDQIGTWKYTTTCTDVSNTGLHNQSGSFECTAYSGDNPLYQRGELRLSDNKRYIEYNDGTPYFFMGDTVWCGPAFAKMDDWNVFLQDRVEKNFNAIQFVTAQWRMFDKDRDGNRTFTGHDAIEINPNYFQRLDAYVDEINNAGLFAVPVVLWAIRGDANPGFSLPVDQRIVLAEYIIARYGAHQVLWFLGGDGNYSGELAEDWHKIGRAVLSKDQHRLTTMHVRGESWVGDEFRNEPWFDFLTYQSGHGDSDKTFNFIHHGPPANDWEKEPTLPIINTEPNYEGHNGYKNRKVHNDHSVRRAAYWSLLVSPTAGVSYGGQGIWGWHNEVSVPVNHNNAGLGSPWYIAKDLPGSFSMMELVDFFDSIEWWRLEPAPDMVINQPGNDNASLYIAAAKTDTGDTAVIYIPEGMEVKINTKGLTATKAQWYHPRVGGWIDAGKVEQGEQTFKPEDRNDWVLLLSR